MPTTTAVPARRRRRTWTHVRPSMVVATDGSCVRHPDGRAADAWAYAFEVNGVSTVRTGVVADGNGSAHRVELLAVAAALRANRHALHLELLVDRRPVVDVLSAAAARQRAGWRRNGGGTLTDTDVLDEIVDLLAARGSAPQVVFTWVKGHAGGALNTLADTGARQTARLAAAALRV
jgi:ribonuclease HI